MIIPETYVLANELAKKGNINIANFSNFIKKVNENNIPDTVLVYGNCTFINADSMYVPNNFLKLIYVGEKCTDLKNMILSSTITKELECKDSELLKIKEFGGVKVTVSGKKFIRFNQYFSDILKKYVLTNVNEADYYDCLKNNDIVGGVKLSKKNYLVWY